MDLGYFWHCAVSPANISELTTFYFIWVGMYLAINIGWDVLTPKTPSFHLKMLTKKVKTSYDAAAGSSSLLILLALKNPEVAKLTTDTVVPLVLAGFSGVLLAISEICPYDINVAGMLPKIGAPEEPIAPQVATPDPSHASGGHVPAKPHTTHAGPGTPDDKTP